MTCGGPNPYYTHIQSVYGNFWDQVEKKKIEKARFYALLVANIFLHIVMTVIIKTTNNLLDSSAAKENAHKISRFMRINLNITVFRYLYDLLYVKHSVVWSPAALKVSKNTYFRTSDLIHFFLYKCDF